MSEDKHVRLGPKWSGEFGPLYSVPLIDDLPLGDGDDKGGEVRFRQAMPSRSDLDQCRKKMKLDRVVAGFEVLLSKFMRLNESCLKLLEAKHPDHFATRLSDSENAALEEIRKAVVR